MRRPQFIASQAGRPSGLVGQVIAAIMVRETEAINRAAIAALAVQPDDHVLDVGCGSGRSLELLVPLVPNGSISGVDPSPLMVSRACRRNRRAISRNNAMIAVAAVEALPFEAETFDAIMSVHTLYFWPDLGSAALELSRVLRPGGRLVLAFRTSANPASTSFPSEIYRFRRLDEVERELTGTGLYISTAIPDGEDGAPAMLTAIKPPGRS
jgi:ubiquinone/menaquinone biosynthesis C-methylase UbiE